MKKKKTHINKVSIVFAFIAMIILIGSINVYTKIKDYQYFKSSLFHEDTKIIYNYIFKYTMIFPDSIINNKDFYDFVELNTLPQEEKSIERVFKKKLFVNHYNNGKIFIVFGNRTTTLYNLEELNIFRFILNSKGVVTGHIEAYNNDCEFYSSLTFLLNSKSIVNSKHLEVLRDIKGFGIQISRKYNFDKPDYLSVICKKVSKELIIKIRCMPKNTEIDSNELLQLLDDYFSSEFNDIKIDYAILRIYIPKSPGQELRR